MGLCLLVYSIHIGDLLFMQHFLYHALHQRVVMGHTNIVKNQEECRGIQLFTQPYFHKHIGNVYLCNITLLL